jgi:hypothetical protein
MQMHQETSTSRGSIFDPSQSIQAEGIDQAPLDAPANFNNVFVNTCSIGQLAADQKVQRALPTESDRIHLQRVPQLN